MELGVPEKWLLKPTMASAALELHLTLALVVSVLSAGTLKVSLLCLALDRLVYNVSIRECIKICWDGAVWNFLLLANVTSWLKDELNPPDERYLNSNSYFIYLEKIANVSVILLTFVIQKSFQLNKKILVPVCSCLWWLDFFITMLKLTDMTCKVTLKMSVFNMPIPVITCTQSHARNHMHTITCMQSHARNHMHMITCTQSHARNHMHAITCTQSHARDHMHAITCTQSHARNHMHTIRCTQSHVRNHMYAITHTQSHAHNHMHAIICTQLLAGVFIIQSFTWCWTKSPSKTEQNSFP